MLGSAALLRDSRKRALARITWWASMVGSARGVFTCRGFFLDCFTCKTIDGALMNTSWEAESPGRKSPRGHSRYLFPGGGLLFSQVFFPTAVAHQVPGAASDSAIAAVAGPAAAEVADAVVALASGVAAAACRAKKKIKKKVIIYVIII